MFLGITEFDGKPEFNSSSGISGELDECVIMLKKMSSAENENSENNISPYICT